jgi:S-DNA-T family DNA segregation ATPase FtsK/SpoIIIE
MARKQKKPDISNRKKPKNNDSALNGEKFRFIVGVLVLIVTAYILIAFISFVFYGAADQSKLDLKWVDLVFKSDIKVENKAGKTGAGCRKRL